MDVILFTNSDHVHVFSLLLDCYGNEHVRFVRID